jgi:molybdopterin-guanine dinucleotide biosynthesis protein A
MTEKISGVVLAGGAGSRFYGRMKPKIVIGGETIISKIISVISEIFDEIIIVTNNPEEFSDLSFCRIIQDEVQNAGPLGGIHSALKASSGSAIFVFAGDMPFLDRNVILKMLEAYRDSNSEALIPEIGEFTEPLHSIYNRSITQHLEDYLRSEASLAVRAYTALLKVRYIQFEGSPGIKKAFTNINSPSDLDTP